MCYSGERVTQLLPFADASLLSGSPENRTTDFYSEANSNFDCSFNPNDLSMFLLNAGSTVNIMDEPVNLVNSFSKGNGQKPAAITKGG